MLYGEFCKEQDKMFTATVIKLQKYSGSVNPKYYEKKKNCLYKHFFTPSYKCYLLCASFSNVILLNSYRQINNCR